MRKVLEMGVAFAHSGQLYSSSMKMQQFAPPRVTAAKLIELGYELPHSPILQSLYPCDFFLLPKTKNSYARQVIDWHEKFISVTEAYFSGFQ